MSVVVRATTGFFNPPAGGARMTARTLCNNVRKARGYTHLTALRMRGNSIAPAGQVARPA